MSTKATNIHLCFQCSWHHRTSWFFCISWRSQCQFLYRRLATMIEVILALSQFPWV
jgi:hypothetical protein